MTIIYYREDLDSKRKTPATSQCSSTTQTTPDKPVEKRGITEEDLTSEAGPSDSYWEVLAERRRAALEESLCENQELHERIHVLEEELDTSKQLLEETRNLVEVLTEMLQEGENEKEEDDLDASLAEEAKEKGDD